MQKNAKFNSLTRIPGATKLVQGVKNGRIPANAFAGGNGSFIVGERAKLILSLNCETGEFIQKDIYYDVKTYTARKFTEAFCRELETLMKDFNFLVEDNRIINLDEVLLKLL